MKQRQPDPISVRAIAAALLLAVSWPVMAHADTDPLIEGARQCTQYFPGEEHKNNIPAHLLAAIATTESGRYHKGLGMSVPWPWTINVEGKGYYFNSKAEAIAQVQGLLAKGYQSIDVGCMQVNLKHHPRAFANLNEAFDPATNVSYAAKFLHDNYATLGDWIKATAAYHSRTPVYGNQYLVEIERSWNRIVAKVAEARASRNASTVAAEGLGAESSAPSTATLAPAQENKPRIVAEMKPRVVEGRSMQPTRHARVIEVKDSTVARYHSPVMVVRAEQAPAPVPTATLIAQTAANSKPVAVADATRAAALAPQGGVDSVRRVNLDNRIPSALPTAATADNSRFVFAN